MKKSDIDVLFRYRAPLGDQPQMYEELRGEARLFASAVMDLCPDSEARDTAIAKIREALSWANASIAQS